MLFLDRNVDLLVTYYSMHICMSAWNGTKYNFVLCCLLVPYSLHFLYEGCIKSPFYYVIFWFCACVYYLHIAAYSIHVYLMWQQYLYWMFI